MQFILGNAYGWLALAGIPIILGIHLFQAKRAQHRVTTLFLLENEESASQQGRTLSPLVTSKQLLLQLLAVLLLTLILIEPRIIRRDSVSRIVVVLDASFSMQPFRSALKSDVLPRIRSLAGLSAHTEWLILESSMRVGRIFGGGDGEAMERRLDEWTPDAPHHDPAAAFAAARPFVPPGQQIVFVTDRLIDAPGDVLLLAIGRTIENAGFTGITVSPTHEEWTVLLRNYGSQSAERRWTVRDSAGSVKRSEAVTLPAGAVTGIKGRFDAGDEMLVLELDPDEFTLDDRFPFIRPAPWTIAVGIRTGDRTRAAVERVLHSLPDVIPTDDESRADALVFECPEPGCAPPRKAPAIVFQPENGLSGGKAVSGATGNPDSELVESLGWDSLRTGGEVVAPPVLDVPIEPIVRHGELDLVSVAGSEAPKTLYFHFSPAHSNMWNLPASVVLMHRYLDTVRRELPRLRRENFELSQSVPVPRRFEHSAVLSVEGRRIGEAGELLRAPRSPAIFDVSADGVPLVRGAAHFADAREADFRAATRSGGIDSLRASILERNSDSTFIVVMLLSILAAVLAALWVMS